MGQDTMQITGLEHVPEADRGEVIARASVEMARTEATQARWGNIAFAVGAMSVFGFLSTCVVVVCG